MRINALRVFWAVAFFATSAASIASTVSLVPTGLIQGHTGDRVSLDIVLDFSDVANGTLGGGFDITFDASALSFVSTIDYGCISFSCGPDVLDGLLYSWGVADFHGIAGDGPVTIGTVEFEILSALPLGASTLVTIGGTDGIAGPWVSADDFTTILHPTYNGTGITRIPLPAAFWLLFSGLSVLSGRHWMRLFRSR